MAQVSNCSRDDDRQLLPIDGDGGVCMACKETPLFERTVTCATCATPWHVDCLVEFPDKMEEIASYVCPDCSGGGLTGVPAPAPVSSSNGDLIAKIRAIEADAKLTEREKARKRQELFGGKGVDDEGEEERRKGKEKMNEALALLSQSIKCSFCMQLPERPVTV